MSIPAPVLVYGRDRKLLETRRLVLQTLGGKVYAADDRETTEQLIRDLMPGVLVLCYTLSPEERDLILSFVHAVYPATKVLILRADGPASAQTDDDFSIFTGPRALRRKVEEMLFDQTCPAQRA